MLAKGQDRTRTTKKSSIKDDTDLKNPPILLQIGEETFKKPATEKLAYANRVGVKLTLLPLITEPFLHEIIVIISGSHPIRRSGLYLDDTTNEPTITYSHQDIIAIYRWVQCVRNAFLISLKSIPDGKRGKIGRNGNDAIGMSPPGTIGGNAPQVTGRRGFNIFEYLIGISDSSNRILSFHDEAISKIYGCDSLFKNSGTNNFLEVINDGRENSEIQLQKIHTNLIPTNLIHADLINIKPKNQYDTSDSRLLQKLISWNSYVSQVKKTYDVCASTISTTAYYSTFSTTTSLAHNNLSLVHTQSMLHITHCITNDTPSPSNGQLLPISVIPTENSRSQNNLPKQVPHVPNYTDSY